MRDSIPQFGHPSTLSRPFDQLRSGKLALAAQAAF
jgi:hypothetical protein